MAMLEQIVNGISGVELFPPGTGSFENIHVMSSADVNSKMYCELMET